MILFLTLLTLKVSFSLGNLTFANTTWKNLKINLMRRRLFLWFIFRFLNWSMFFPSLFIDFFFDVIYLWTLSFIFYFNIILLITVSLLRNCHWIKCSWHRCCHPIIILILLRSGWHWGHHWSIISYHSVIRVILIKVHWSKKVK